MPQVVSGVAKPKANIGMKLTVQLIGRCRCYFSCQQLILLFSPNSVVLIQQLNNTNSYNTIKSLSIFTIVVIYTCINARFRRIFCTKGYVLYTVIRNDMIDDVTRLLPEFFLTRLRKIPKFVVLKLGQKIRSDKIDSIKSKIT